jgi:hypothetical protein
MSRSALAGLQLGDPRLVKAPQRGHVGHLAAHDAQRGDRYVGLGLLRVGGGDHVGGSRVNDELLKRPVMLALHVGPLALGSLCLVQAVLAGGLASLGVIA